MLPTRGSAGATAKRAVTGIACLFEGDETGAVPRSTQEDAFLPFSDTVASVVDFLMRRFQRASMLEEYLQDSEPISSLCIGYTDPANIVFSRLNILAPRRAGLSAIFTHS